MMLRIFMAPVSEPGKLTLQADAETWNSLLAELSRGLGARSNTYLALKSALEPSDDRPMRRATLPDAIAREVLAAAGVSA
jgi:hypothetical protein